LASSCFAIVAVHREEDVVLAEEANAGRFGDSVAM